MADPNPTPVRKTVTLHIVATDIERGECANRRRCVLAQAVDREIGLAGKGYINVDAHEIAYTFDGWRYRYKPPRAAMRYLREFDQLGETQGWPLRARRCAPRRFISICTLTVRSRRRPRRSARLGSMSCGTRETPSCVPPAPSRASPTAAMSGSDRFGSRSARSRYLLVTYT